MADVTEVPLESRHPQLHLPNGQTIPAIVVPILLSTAFVAWKLFERRWPERLPEKKTSDDEKSAEKPESKSEAVDEENLKKAEPSDPNRKRLAIFAAVVCGFCFFATMIASASPWMPRWLLTTLVTGHLAGTTALYLCVSSAVARFHGRILGLTSVMMLGLAWLYSMPPWPLPLVALLCTIALLSWWPSQQSGYELEDSIRFYSTGLMMLIIRANIPDSMWPREGDHREAAPRSIMLICYSPVLLLILWKAICRWVGLEPWTDGAVNTASTKRKICFDVLMGVAFIVFMAGFLGLLYGFIGLAQFATSCIGFNWLIMREPATDPSFLDHNLGSSTCMILWMYFQVKRGKVKSMRQFLAPFVDSAGWTIIGALSLGLLLLPVDALRG